MAILATVARAQQAEPPHEPDDINQKRWEWFFTPRAYPLGYIPDTARLKALAEMERLSVRRLSTQSVPVSNQALASTQWTSIGPQPIGTAPYQYSGRVWSIAIDPRNSSVVYIATDSGGIWKTTDGGMNWSPLTDNQPSLITRSVALAPSSPDTIYAATYGAGVLKSTDGGATWVQSVGPFQSGSSVFAVQSVAVQPTNSQVVLAAANGIYRSADGGSTWSGVSTNFPVQVVFDPSDSSRAYAAGGGIGVVRSTDGGLTWSALNGTGANTLPVSMKGNFYLAIAPSNPSILYAGERRDTAAYFYKSVDGGTNWTPIGTPQNDLIAYWPWTLQVHPTNPNIVFAGSLLIHRTTDGGVTWANVSGQPSPHVDHHAQTFTADGSKLYIGSDGGVWSTTNPTDATISWTGLNTTLATALFYPGLSIHPTNIDTSFGGTQDNGTLRYTGSTNWKGVTCGDGGWTAIDFSQPQNVYSTCQAGSLVVVEKSASNGDSGTFQQAQSGINLQDPSIFIPPLVMDPSNSHNLYFGTNRVYQSTNSAGSWTAISGVLATNDNVIAMSVAPSDSNTVYASVGYGPTTGVFVTRSALSGGAATWVNRSAGLANVTITQIAIHPQDPLTAYATASGYGSPHVYRTTNGGVSWSSTGNSNLPDIPVNDILIDPDQTTILYVATDIGVFRSNDGGASWLPVGAGLPHVVVHAIRLHRPSRTLRAATYGRGAWDIWVPLDGQVQVAISAGSIDAPFSLEDGSIFQAPVTFSWTSGDKHTITWLASSAKQPGGRYSFQGWSDSTANPRTITVPSAPATYTANVKAQYLLSASIVPTGAGSVTFNPASTDGFYDAGASVVVTATAASGYNFSYFSGDTSSSSSPLTVSLTQARNITANFYCTLQLSPPLPAAIGPGPTSGIIVWQLGAGCMWSVSSSSNWITLGGASSGTGSGSFSYSIPENTGASRTGTVTFTSAGNYNFQMNVTQTDPNSGPPSTVSAQPNSGSGSNQVFAFQFHDRSGFANITAVGVSFENLTGGNPCTIYYNRYGPQSMLSLVSDDGNSSLGPLTLPSAGVLQNSKCIVDGARSSLSGSGKLLNLNLGMVFKTAFAGDKRITINYVYDSTANISSSSQIAGTWTVPATPQAAITIASNVSGAAFALEDNTIYQAPITFAWVTGSRHTITWMNLFAGQPGARYVFQSWTDGGANPRTITTPSAATTFTANIKAQYLLSATISPASAGTVAFNPVSPDGYYDSGAGVTITAAAFSGFFFSYFSGDNFGSSPQSITMTTPRTITANFGCTYLLYGSVPSTIGPGPTAGLMQWSTGAGCTWSVTNTAGWITLGTPPNGTGAAMVAYSIPENTGGSRSGTVTFTAANSYTTSVVVTQEASTSGRPSPVSVQPNSGSGANQVFAFQFYDHNGYGKIDSANISFNDPAGHNFCGIYYGSSAQSAWVYLASDDSGNLQGPLNLPGSGTLQNSRCILDASKSSSSGAGNLLSLSLGLTFKPAFAGDKLILVSSAHDSTGNLYSQLEILGTWTVPSPSTAVTIAATAAGAPFSLEDGTTYTAPMTFSWTVGAQHTVTWLGSISSQPGARYAFQNWTDSGPNPRTITVPSAATTYTANLKAQFKLTIAISPAGSGTVANNPTSPDGYYDSGSTVMLSASPTSGYGFLNFIGDVAGLTSPQPISMAGPRNVTANFLAPGMTLVKSHAGIFTQGQQNAQYSIVVSNASGAGPISGTVTVTETVPSGLTLVSMSGSGWSCSSNVCTRSDSLLGGSSYPPITVTVNVAAKATSPQVNQASVSAPGTTPLSVSDSTTISTGPGTLSLDRQTVNFGVSGSLITSPQSVAVNFINGSPVAWTASSNQSTITLSPASGAGNGTFLVTAKAGSSGVITVTASGAGSSPQQVQVNVATVPAGAPFGSFDTPVANATGLAGAIAVTGWALDNIEVTSLDISREPIAGETPGANGLVFIGNAVFVEGARPDVAASYPTLPFKTRAGWGYMLLTNFLPNGGGTFKLHAIAHGKAGTLTDLGAKIITVDNAHASKPFGTIDTPGQGGAANGAAYVNFGWALTQQPYVIPTDGSSVLVYVDGVQQTGHATYNNYRSDIATIFPGLQNSNGAVGYYTIDTTKLSNAVHTIFWTVADSGGRADGIGSRYFTVLNGSASTAATEETIAETPGRVTLRGGLDARQEPAILRPYADGGYSVTMEQLGRIELRLGAVRARKLPVGSTLKAGVFYWHPGPAFLGEYEFQFERADGTIVPVRVTIRSKQ